MKEEIIQRRKEETKSLADNMLSQINSGKRFQDIASSNELSLGEAGKILRSHFGKKYMDLRNEAINRDLEAVSRGEEHLFKVRVKFRFAPHSFHNLLSRSNRRDLYLLEKPVKGLAVLDLFDSLKEDGDSTLDKLCREGVSLPAMAEVKGMSRQQVEQYILGSGQHNLWYERRNQAKQEKKQIVLDEKAKQQPLLDARGDLINTLKEKVFSLSADANGLTSEQRAEITAAQTHLKIEGDYNRLPKLYSLFLRYYQSKEKGEDKSLRSIITEEGYDMSAASRYFEVAGLHNISDVPRVSKEEKANLKKARKTKFSVEDIKFFLNSDRCHLSIRDNMLGDRKAKSACYFAKEKGLEGTYRIPYRLASQIYESKAYGYNNTETAQITNTTPYLVQQVLARRKTIEKDIISGLRRIYPDKKITRSYLSTNQRSRK